MGTWQCSYCKQNATIRDSDWTAYEKVISPKSKDGQLALSGHVLVCPNEECREYEIHFRLTEVKFDGDKWVVQRSLRDSRLRPESRAKPYPAYIPESIRNDYNEACAIEVLSPKASATLARRCLQGLIRDFYKIGKGTLNEEIAAIQAHVSPELWQAIDALRVVGNIGAHPERDINLIVDVEPGEAAALIELIELLFRVTYQDRHRDQQLLADVTKVANEKKALRAGPVPAASAASRAAAQKV